MNWKEKFDSPLCGLSVRDYQERYVGIPNKEFLQMLQDGGILHSKDCEGLGLRRYREENAEWLAAGAYSRFREYCLNSRIEYMSTILEDLEMCKKKFVSCKELLHCYTVCYGEERQERALFLLEKLPFVYVDGFWMRSYIPNLPKIPRPLEEDWYWTVEQAWIKIEDLATAVGGSYRLALMIDTHVFPRINAWGK